MSRAIVCYAMSEVHSIFEMDEYIKLVKWRGHPHMRLHMFMPAWKG